MTLSVFVKWLRKGQKLRKFASLYTAKDSLTSPERLFFRPLIGVNLVQALHIGNGFADTALDGRYKQLKT